MDWKLRSWLARMVMLMVWPPFSVEGSLISSGYRSKLMNVRSSFCLAWVCGTHSAVCLCIQSQVVKRMHRLSYGKQRRWVLQAVVERGHQVLRNEWKWTPVLRHRPTRSQGKNLCQRQSTKCRNWKSDLLRYHLSSCWHCPHSMQSRVCVL